MPPLPTGTHLGNYEILGLLGVGGMGEVYRARDTKLQRDVAIKILPAQQDARLGRAGAIRAGSARASPPSIIRTSSRSTTSSNADGRRLHRDGAGEGPSRSAS